MKNIINMGKSFERGSEWRKWDLHVHTKYTNKNDQFTSPDFNVFCEKLFKRALEKDIHAIGITDYFSIENYLKVLKFVDDIHSSSYFNEIEKDKIKKILLLPNVELRMLPVTDKGKLINIHCIFNPSYLACLENDFFGSIMFTCGQRPYQMNKSGFISLGKSFDSSLNEDAAYKKGVDNFVVSHEKLKEVFDSNPRLRDNTIVVVSNSNNDGASALQKHYELFINEPGALDGVRKSIYYISDCVFSGNSRDVEFFLGKKPGFDAEMVKCKCGSLKPCIHGSDAHTEEKLFCPDDNKFCWIKADLSFSGLKQIIYEPEERVRIQQDKPDDKKSYQVIDYVSLSEQNFWEQTIYLNENLNTIIGVRSTGKSTLLKSIAKKIDGQIDEESDFVENHLAGVDVKWKDSLSNSSRFIQYLPQNYMHEIAKNESRELDELIQKILVNKGEHQSLEEFVEKNKTIQTNISKSVLDVFQIQKKLEGLQSQLKETGDKTGVEGEIKRLEGKIKDLSSDSEMSGFCVVEYQNVVKKIGQIQDAINHAETDKSSLIRLKALSIINENVKNIFVTFSDTISDSLSKTFDLLKKNVKEQWEIQVDNLICELEKKIRERNEEKVILEQSEVNKKGMAYYEKNKELSDIQSKLKEEFSRLQRIEDLEKMINVEETHKTDVVRLIVNEHLRYKENVKLLSDSLKISRDDVEISTKIQLKSEDIYEFLKNRCNLRGEDRQKYILNIKNNYGENTEVTVRKMIEDTLQNKIDLKNSYTSQSVLTEFLMKNWFEYSFELTYQNDVFNEMSPGKRAFVILKLLLDFDERECPILIDQPEDSLDNRAIYKELVEYIREKKKTRQIILVTHNSNVVVGADAENVIVANHHGIKNLNDNGCKFQYINGSMESSVPRDSKFLPEKDPILTSQGIREHVCDILEGGKDAFEKREKKYGFN